MLCINLSAEVYYNEFFRETAAVKKSHLNFNLNIGLPLFVQV